jgi:hypothetical protein
MSKERARLRAARAEEAAARARENQRALARRNAAQARRGRVDLFWRRLRLWRHGAAFARNKEKWAALATLVLASLLVTYLFSRSVTDVVLVALVCVVATPALVALFFDRSSS